LIVTLGDRDHIDGWWCVLGELSRSSLVGPKKVGIGLEFTNPELENRYLLERT